MRTIKNPNLAQLLMQLRFTPEDKRRNELEAAEKLYALIDDTRQYPFDFVCFHITGFHPQTGIDHHLIDGKDLREDLELFIAKLSGKLVTSVQEQGERVYTAEELAERFNVSTKTITRWRRRGLLARKFRYHDGGRRYGFLESTVERFVQENPNLVDQAGRFRRLTTKQRQQIVRQARAWRQGRQRHATRSSNRSAPRWASRTRPFATRFRSTRRSIPPTSCSKDRRGG